MKVALVGLLALVAAAGTSAAAPARQTYELRSTPLVGGAARILFKAPIRYAEYAERFVLDVSPTEPRALMDRVVLTGPDASNDIVYVADLHGRHGRAVTSTSAFTPFVRWAPDGKRVSFETYDGEPCRDFTFWSAGADGAARAELARGQLFAWGADSRSFAVTEGCAPGSSEWRLVFVDAGGRRHQIATGWAAPIATAPDGRLLAYLIATRAGWMLHLGRTDGSGDVGRSVPADSVAWSPDGTRLALVRHGNLLLASRSGRPGRTLARGGVIPDSPRWSPDGRWISFVRNYRTIEVASPAHGTPQIVARGANVLHAWWPRHGRRLYYDGWF